MSHEEEFEQHRAHLFAVAYGMLGSGMDAEDTVQEAFLHWLRVRDAVIASPRAYLTTIVTRLCLDQKRVASRRPEIPLDSGTIEPLPDETAADFLALAEKNDMLGLALAIMLQSLAPLERAVFLLREVFDYSYSEISCLVGKSEANCRQILRRARQNINTQNPRFEIAAQQREGVTKEFLVAALGGDMAGLITTLTDQQMSNWASRVAQCCTN